MIPRRRGPLMREYQPHRTEGESMQGMAQDTHRAFDTWQQTYPRFRDFIGKYEDDEGDAAELHYGARVFYERETNPATGEDFTPARVELLLAGGGPTHILTWDSRGPGWSDFFDSWGEPDSWQISGDEWETVGRYIAAMVAPMEV